MDIEYAMSIVKLNGNRLQLIKDPTPEIREAAIKRTPTAINFIPTPTIDEQKLAVSRQGEIDREGLMDLVSMINDVDFSILEETVGIYGHCIKLIDKPTYAHQLLAVSTDGDAIQHIPNPDNKLQMMAINAHNDNLGHIQSPDYDVVEYVIKNNPRMIEHVRSPHIDHQKYVLETIPEDGLHYLTEVDPDLALSFITENPEKIEQMANPTEECCWAALMLNSSLIKAIKNPTPEMESYAKLVSDGN